MLRSYLKIAYRNILKNKGYSFINIFGLSLGIACCLLMFNYVRFEFSYDNFHPDLDRTYRVDQTMPGRAQDGIVGSTAPPLANALATNYPEIEETLRINTPGNYIIRYADRSDHVLAYYEDRVFAADSSFFSFFGFPLKEGDPRTALIGVNKVVISEEVAKKFFGDESALGKMLLLGDAQTAIEVTGVTTHQPENSHFHFDYLLSMETNPNVKKRDWSWVWTQVVTYIRLKPGADSKALEEKMAGFGEKVIRPAFESIGWDYDNGKTRKDDWKFYLRPMRDLHLKTGNNRIGPVGDIKYAYAFGVIGIFVLIIAAINFINLSTARGTKRAKEVGVKKTLGALRSALISQFQTESILLALISTALALVLVEGLRLMITKLAGIDITFTLWRDPAVLIMIPFIPLVIGFLSGLYPSFYLTAFRPIQVLKGKIASGMGNSALRNALVVIQFTISIALIAGTLIVFQQLKFLSSTNLGFNKENVLLIKYAEKLGTHLEAFRSELESFQGVEDVGTAMEVPGGGRWSDDFVKEGSEAGVHIAIVKIDEHYFNTLNFKLVAGRAFDKQRPSDKNAVIPNETTVRSFGWTPEQAIGQYIIYPGNNNTRHEIIGVMKDAHYQSLRQAISPIMFCKVDADIWGDWRVLTVKFKSANISSLIKQIEKKWNDALDDTPMSYSFLDDELARQYEAEEKLGGLFGIFSGLSILIAIIGLVGLVSYSTEIRKKEIGIRKVFGASTTRILILMNSQYVKLILVALFIAVPLSWWVIIGWLDSFAYRIEISPLTFIFAGLAELVVAILTVGYLSLRAATLNPSHVLKEE
jgi:putative ABC transport system permease protein